MHSDISQRNVLTSQDLNSLLKADVNKQEYKAASHLIYLIRVPLLMEQETSMFHWKNGISLSVAEKPLAFLENACEKRKSSDESEEVQVKIVSAVDNGAH
ncbi:hypothetical protein WN943_027601 [Citrus x changshan-huyou]